MKLKKELQYDFPKKVLNALMSAFGSIDGPINLGYQLWVVGRSYVWNQRRQIVWWSSKLVFCSSKFSLLLLHCHLHDHTVLQVFWCKDANPRLFRRFHKFHWQRTPPTSLNASNMVICVFTSLVVLCTSESKILQLLLLIGFLVSAWRLWSC